MRRILAVMAGLVLCSTGCIKLEQTLTIKQDASANLDISYGMAEATITQMQAMSQGMDKQGGAKEEKNDFEFDEAKIKAKLAKLEKDGITVKSVTTTAKDGWKYMHIKLDAKNVSALNKTEFMNNMSLTKNAAGNYVLVMDDKKKDKGGDEQMNEQMMAQMAPMFAGFRAVMKIVVPGKIIETDAGEKSETTATWTYDIEKDPKALMKAEKDAGRVVFSSSAKLPEVKGSKEDVAPATEKK